MNLVRAKQIDGWMSDLELEWLAEQAARSEMVIEVGCYKGRSTRALADNCKGTVFAIDPYKGDYLYPDGRVMMNIGDNIYKQFLDNLDDVIKTQKVIHFRQELSQMHNIRGDFIFLDGDHRYEPLRSDIFSALRLANPNGLIAGHDYGHPDWPDVSRVVNEMFSFVNKVGTIWWIRL